LGCQSDSVMPGIHSHLLIMYVTDDRHIVIEKDTTADDRRFICGMVIAIKSLTTGWMCVNTQALWLFVAEYISVLACMQ